MLVEARHFLAQGNVLTFSAGNTIGHAVAEEMARLFVWACPSAKSPRESLPPLRLISACIMYAELTTVPYMAAADHSFFTKVSARM